MFHFIIKEEPGNEKNTVSSSCSQPCLCLVLAGCGDGSQGNVQGNAQGNAGEQSKTVVVGVARPTWKRSTRAHMYEPYANMVAYADLRHAPTASRAVTTWPRRSNPSRCRLRPYGGTSTVYTFHPARRMYSFCQRQPPFERRRGVEHPSGHEFAVEHQGSRGRHQRNRRSR